MNIVVNVSDARVSADPGAVLATYALGSCIAVALYDSQAKLGGLLHFQLPTSELDPARARQNPFMFADTGMATLLAQLVARGSVARRLRVVLAGAAQTMDDQGLFNIGRRNHAAVRKILWQRGLLIANEDIGGTQPRDVYLSLLDGAVRIKTIGRA